MLGVLLGQNDSPPAVAGVALACWLQKGGAMPSQMSRHTGSLRSQVSQGSQEDSQEPPVRTCLFTRAEWQQVDCYSGPKWWWGGISRKDSLIALDSPVVCHPHLGYKIRVLLLGVTEGKRGVEGGKPQIALGSNTLGGKSGSHRSRAERF